MNIREEHVSTCVAFGPTTNHPVVRITSVYRESLNPSIGYVSSDGHHEGVTASMFQTLDESTANWRPATQEETDTFTRHYRPAPENWN